MPDQNRRDYDKYKYYSFDFNGSRIDPYRILLQYGITHPAQQHAIKKLLRAGRKEGNDLTDEIDQVIATLDRWKEMIAEDGNPPIPTNDWITHAPDRDQSIQHRQNTASPKRDPSVAGLRRSDGI